MPENETKIIIVFTASILGYLLQDTENNTFVAMQKENQTNKQKLLMCGILINGSFKIIPKYMHLATI